MPHPQWSQDESWISSDPSLAFNAANAADTAPEGARPSAPTTELEPGWRAIRALMQLHSDELLAVMLRPSFRPVRDLDLVTVSPCGYCCDGGLRTAGSVRVRRGRVLVRACDTCGAVEVGDQLTVAPKERR
jgi:hypothetical protein